MPNRSFHFNPAIDDDAYVDIDIRPEDIDAAVVSDAEFDMYVDALVDDMAEQAAIQDLMDFDWDQQKEYLIMSNSIVTLMNGEELTVHTTTDPEWYRENCIKKNYRKGYFKHDDHQMDINFSLKKTTVGFYGVYYTNPEDEIVAFCSCEVYELANGTKLGYIRCQGVIDPYRGNGLSPIVLQDAEDFAYESQPEMKKILSTCNPVSAHVHEKVGYKIVHPGHLTKNGKLCMIKLEKEMPNN